MREFKVSWEKSKLFTILNLVQYLVGIFLIIGGFSLQTIALEISIIAIGIVLITVASSQMKSVQDGQKLDQILTKLSELEDLQKEQKEQAGPGTPIVASLEAMTRYYMDYLNKQKGEDNK